MASQNLFTASPYNGVATSTLGKKNPFLPQDFNFNDLANYAQTTGDQYATNLTSKLAKRRSDLATSLNTQGKGLFDMALPDINEGLNASGVYTSPTARATAEANALKQIDLSNQNYLNDFDTSSVAAELGADQNTMDTVLGLRGNQLESQLQQGQTNQEMALADKLSKQQSRTSLLNSLIGAGGNVGGSLLAAKMLGGGLAHGAATAGTAGAAGAVPGVAATPGLSTLGSNPLSVYGTGTAGTAGAGTGSLGAFGTGAGGLAAIGGAGIGAAMLSRAAEKRAGGGLQGTAAGILANPIGSQLNAAKKLVTNPSQAVNNALGQGHSNGTGSGGGTATEQRQLDSELSTLQGLRSQVQSGQLSPEEYQSQAQAMIDDISQRVGSLTSKSSAWANAINPNWKRFQDQGFARAENGRWVAG